jgi:cysteine synthase
VAAALQDNAIGGGGGGGGGSSAAAAAARPRPLCYIVEPENAPVLAVEAGATSSGGGDGSGRHKIQGGGYSMTAERLPLISRNWERFHMAGYLQVSDREAMDCCRMLASSEGLFGVMTDIHACLCLPAAGRSGLP